MHLHLALASDSCILRLHDSERIYLNMTDLFADEPRGDWDVGLVLASTHGDQPTVTSTTQLMDHERRLQVPVVAALFCKS